MIAAIDLGDVLWAMVTFFFMVIYFIILFNVITDLFRNHETSGVVKALWIIALLLVPFLSLLIYVLIHGDGMAKRNIKAQSEVQAQMDDYVKQTAGATPADQIAQAKKLLDAGTIDQAEYEALKRKALA